MGRLGKKLSVLRKPISGYDGEHRGDFECVRERKTSGSIDSISEPRKLSKRVPPPSASESIEQEIEREQEREMEFEMEREREREIKREREKELEAQRKAQEEREAAARVPGMLKPSQIKDEDEEL